MYEYVTPEIGNGLIRLSVCRNNPRADSPPILDRSNGRAPGTNGASLFSVPSHGTGKRLKGQGRVTPRMNPVARRVRCHPPQDVALGRRRVSTLRSSARQHHGFGWGITVTRAIARFTGWHEYGVIMSPCRTKTRNASIQASSIVGYRRFQRR
jgi:hypothetical protein